jgi:hypothetical protein
MDVDDIGDVLGSVTDLLDQGGDFLRAVRELKTQWRGVQSGQSSARSSLHSTGPSVAAEVREVAAANGDPWIPDMTGGYGGIDLTGVWCPPMNVFDQCMLRQSGAYLNVAAVLAGTMIFAGEGLFDLRTRAIGFAGRYANGAPAQVRAQLLPNQMINGILTVANPWSVPMSNPLVLQRLQ